MSRDREQRNDYQRGYQRGVAKGRADMERQSKELEAEVARMQARAERAEAGAGLGQCQACRFWQRPGPSHKWGPCSARRPGSVHNPETPWQESQENQSPHRDVSINTRENFGCVLFEPATPIRMRPDNG